MFECYLKSNRYTSEASRRYEERFRRSNQPNVLFLIYLAINLLNCGIFEQTRYEC